MAPMRVYSTLLKIVTMPPRIEIANEIRQAIFKNRVWVPPRFIKKASKKTRATIEAIFCFSRSLINITARLPKTAMKKDMIDIKLRKIGMPLEFTSKFELVSGF